MLGVETHSSLLYDQYDDGIFRAKVSRANFGRMPLDSNAA
jgi:hypothetical protein